MTTPMRGWKTWTGVALLVVAGALRTLASLEVLPLAVSEALIEGLFLAGGAFGLVGLGSKIEKNR